MGCNGCELYNPKWPNEKNHCYAARVMAPKAGLKGWPIAFDKPTIFPGRIEKAVSWSDLTNTPRPAKEWLDNYPRIIFLNDMGDGFTEDLDIYWLKDYVNMMEQSPHIWLWLTKRPKRMIRFFRKVGHVPKNFWLGTSVTSNENVVRAWDLIDILDFDPNALLWLSIEPLIGNIKAMLESDILKTSSWVALGGESGDNPRLLSIPVANNVVGLCKSFGTPVFVKQMGSAWAQSEPVEDANGITSPYKMGDRHGIMPGFWPEALRIKQMPELPK